MSLQDLHKERTGQMFNTSISLDSPITYRNKPVRGIRDFGTELVSTSHLGTIPEPVPLVLVLDLLTVLGGHGVLPHMCYEFTNTGKNRGQRPL
jgi:hypothetical protein